MEADAIFVDAISEVSVRYNSNFSFLIPAY
jgi:hypothetical protein